MEAKRVGYLCLNFSSNLDVTKAAAHCVSEVRKYHKLRPRWTLAH